jgi:hypothetical protein
VASSQLPSRSMSRRCKHKLETHTDPIFPYNVSNAVVITIASLYNLPGPYSASTPEGTKDNEKYDR